jgi:hypothetical protein
VLIAAEFVLTLAIGFPNVGFIGFDDFSFATDRASIGTRRLHAFADTV